MRSSRLFNLRYILASVLALFSYIYVSAHDFDEDGLYYEYVSDGVELVVGMVSHRYGYYFKYPQGDIVIPARTRNGYKVVGLGPGVLCEVSSVSIPATVRYINGNVYSFSYDPYEVAEQSCMKTIVVDPANAVFDSREDCNAIIRKADNMLIVGSSSTVIPNSVVGIESKAFVGNTYLKKLVVPNSVTSIGYSALENVQVLKMWCYLTAW